MSTDAPAPAVNRTLTLLEVRVNELARRCEQLAAEQRSLRIRKDELQIELDAARAAHRSEVETQRNGFEAEITELRSRFEDELQCRRTVFETDLETRRIAYETDLENQRNAYEAELEDLRMQYLETRTRIDLMVARLRAVETHP